MTVREFDTEYETLLTDRVRVRVTGRPVEEFRPDTEQATSLHHP